MISSCAYVTKLIISWDVKQIFDCFATYENSQNNWRDISHNLIRTYISFLKVCRKFVKTHNILLLIWTLNVCVHQNNETAELIFRNYLLCLEKVIPTSISSYSKTEGSNVYFVTRLQLFITEIKNPTFPNWRDISVKYNNLSLIFPCRTITLISVLVLSSYFIQ